MNDPSMSKNRMAELATELLGAKMIAEFVRDAWAMMPDDAKSELAAALARKVVERVNADDWAIRGMVDALIAEEAQSRADALRPVVAAAVEAALPKVLERQKAGLEGVIDRFFTQNALRVISEACATRMKP